MMKNKIWFPLIATIVMALMVCVGMFIGERRAAVSSSYSAYLPVSVDVEDMDGTMATVEASSKLVYLFDLLRNQYVDSLDLTALVEDAIPTIIEELDPHSNYIPAEELSKVNEELGGSFSGVGIQFNIQQDTVMVIQVIAGGPSSKVGIMPGDRIVTVDDSLFVGKQITNDKVLKTLRGEKNSLVKLGIRRASSEELLTFDVIRGDVPVESVVAAYLEGKNGYIRVDNFGQNTYAEFFNALVKLRAQGAEGFMIDLRGNGGGYMEVCVLMVNEFLSAHDLIVYTEGRNFERQDINADGQGNFQNVPVVVLIDDWSASASEIFSGALQDNDRATIIGHRSFGKGLVQQQIDLNDGSAVRLTVARYYTPSGRCIQKPYEMGQRESYMMDVLDRYAHGEFYSQDSIRFADSLRYETVGGRSVYAGGGIMPDIFVPTDTAYITPYYTRCVNSGLIYSFAFQYNDRHRQQLAGIRSFDEMMAHLRQENLLQQFVSYAQPTIPVNQHDLAISGKEIENLIHAYIMRHVGKENWSYQVFNSKDETYLRGMKILNEGKAWPSLQ